MGNELNHVLSAVTCTKCSVNFSCQYQPPPPPPLKVLCQNSNCDCTVIIMPKRTYRAHVARTSSQLLEAGCVLANQNLGSRRVMGELSYLAFKSWLSCSPEV